MTSCHPYLLRAIYEWIIDNDMTPQLAVNAAHREVKVPRAYIENGKIVLNIHPMAVKDMDLGNQAITFTARFSGASFPVFIPVGAVIAIYAKENGQGLAFGQETGEQQQHKPGRRSGPNLTLIK